MQPFSTPWKLTVFWCFQGVEKGCIENKWVKSSLPVPTLLKKIWVISPLSLMQYLKKMHDLHTFYSSIATWGGNMWSDITWTLGNFRNEIAKMFTSQELKGDIELFTSTLYMRHMHFYLNILKFYTRGIRRCAWLGVTVCYCSKLLRHVIFVWTSIA